MTTLAKAIADLGWERLQVFIVSDGVHEDDWPANPIASIDRHQFGDYDVEPVPANNSGFVTWNSKRAEREWPGHRNVGIRAERLSIRR